MKRKVIAPDTKENSLQAIIDFLVDNGMGEFGANMFIHTNLPALGGDMNILDCVHEEKWEDAWGVVQAYINGDYF